MFFRKQILTLTIFFIFFLFPDWGPHLVGVGSRVPMTLIFARECDADRLINPPTWEGK